MESSCSTFVPLVVNAVVFLVVVLIYTLFFVYNRVVWHVPQVQCWRLCIISKIFRNCVKVTVPSLPKENGVPVKINVIFY